MSESPRSDTTFDRSCQHWSESGKRGMDAFYRLASKDYRLLAENLNWTEILQSLQHRFGNSLNLLDVACGSGQFPKALLEYTTIGDIADLHIDYDLLDPSPFSIETARRQLQVPFHSRNEYCCTLQDLSVPDSCYSVVWATHALYCVPEAELDTALDRMLAAIDQRGLGFIAHASSEAHYLRFHQLYLQHESRRHLQPFCTGEQIIELLRRRGIGVNAWTLDYEGTVDLDDRATVERYLQRCLFDDNISLQEMQQDPDLGPYLAGCVDQAAGVWRFPQSTWLCLFGETAATAKRD